MKKVKDRRAITNYNNAAEKIAGEVVPMLYLENPIHGSPLLVSCFSQGSKNVFASLRDAFTMQFTFAAILRGETLEKADLSDLFEV
jgi:hypothetical protein